MRAADRRVAPGNFCKIRDAFFQITHAGNDVIEIAECG
jgi:hypothetical protein